MEKATADLHNHARELHATTQQKSLLQDASRNSSLNQELPGLLCDYSRQFVTKETMEKLLVLAQAAGVEEKIEAMYRGDRINVTENRQVQHMATRAGVTSTHQVRLDSSDPTTDVFTADGKDVLADLHETQARIFDYIRAVRAGELLGATGKVLKDIVCVGIGGSFLGAKFVYESLRCDQRGGGHAAAAGRTLRFIANVDPVDFHRQMNTLDLETTVVVVASKTFTTAETMLNAETVKRAFLTKFNNDPAVISKHFVACSTNVPACMKFGIDQNKVFPFSDWVGGRFSVCSAVGLVPLGLYFGEAILRDFLLGARDMDVHFRRTPLARNLPVILAMLGIWNSQFLKYPARALACYSDALCDFAAHIQQVDMESNGKRVDVQGHLVVDASTNEPMDLGEIGFGQAGTNSQHSFFQLFHQGRIVPVDFIGFVHSQADCYAHPVAGLTNHDELMCNFFAQPDALALGKADANTHKVMPGNRPSNVLLLDTLTAYDVGVLLSLYEHRTAVQGFVWNINSFDQYGVELGKVLANNIRTAMAQTRATGAATEQTDNLLSSTNTMLKRYLSNKL